MRKKEKAQITIEAAIIMPVIMGIVLLFLQTGFYLRDMIVIQSAVYSAGVACERDSPEEFEDKIEEKAAKIKSYVLRAGISCTETADSFCVKIEYSYKQERVWMKNFGGSLNKTKTIRFEKDMDSRIMCIFSVIAGESS